MNLLRLVSLAVVGAEVQCQGVREEMEQAWDQGQASEDEMEWGGYQKTN